MSRLPFPSSGRRAALAFGLLLPLLGSRGLFAADELELPAPSPSAVFLTPQEAPPGDPSPTESARIEGLPDIGLWMLDPKGMVANWLGIRAAGKKVAEPINIVVVDEISTDAAAAKARLEKALRIGGFPERGGHSGGYVALIGGLPSSEILIRSKGTFSDASFLRENDHGRIFGPYRSTEGFVFTAAFSRERPDTFRMRHVLVSFNVARMIIAEALSSSGLYRIERFVPLGNALFWSRSRTTWDHDGNAVLLEATGEPAAPDGEGGTSSAAAQEAAAPIAGTPAAPAAPMPTTTAAPTSTTPSATGAAVAPSSTESAPPMVDAAAPTATGTD